MSGKYLVLHAGWAVAAVAAFSLGSVISPKGGGESTGKSDESKNQPYDKDRTNNRASSSSNDRDGNKRPNGGPIAGIYGSLEAGIANLDALVEQAFKDSNPITRRLAFGELLASLNTENAAELREKLLTSGADRDEWRDFNYAWGAISGREAFDVAAASDERDLSAVMGGWASANPAEAIGLLDNLPEEMAGMRDQIAEAVVAGLANRDPASATDLAIRLDQEGKGRADRLFRSVATEVLRTEGPTEAARWVEGLPDGNAKGSAMDRIAGSYARANPEEAAKWIEGYAQSEYAERAVAEVGRQWGRSSPDSAVSWLETLPTGKGQEDGLRSVLGDWEDSNPAAATQYLSGMAESPQRDAAISGFARGYAWQDPEVAISWAEGISDSSLRQRTLTRAGQAYFRRDPESARTWLQASGLPENTQQRIMNSRRRR